MRESISRLIELLAEKENIALKIDYLKGKKQDENNPNFVSLSNKLKLLDDEIAQLTAAINNKGVQFYPLCFEELVATENELNVPLEEKAAAIENKTGKVFEAIKKRLQIMKKNLELKDELANVFLFLSGLEDASLKQKVFSSLKSAKQLEAELDLSNEKMKYLADLLFRLGIYPFSKQKKYVVSRDIIWLEGEEAKKMEQVLAELAGLEPALQWKNAQRQIKSFSEEEENEFAEIQRRYLELLKIRDQCVEEYKKRNSAIQFT